MTNSLDLEKLETHIEELLESGTNVIFTFGDAGVGKTCFFITVVKYLNANYRVIYNSKDNKNGLEYLRTHLKELNNQTLPPANSLGEVKEIDISFKVRNEDIVVTFLDMSGEDLRVVDLAESGTTAGSLDDKIDIYLRNPDLSVILLCFIDYDDAENQDELIHSFFSYLKTKYDFDFNRIALIVSKWDKNDEEYNLFDFLKEKVTQSYIWLNQEVKRPNAFAFSVGKIDERNTRRLLGPLDISHCRDIVDWICSVSTTKVSRAVRKQSPFKNVIPYLKTKTDDIISILVKIVKNWL